MKGVKAFILILTFFLVAGMYGTIPAQTSTAANTSNYVPTWTAGKTSVSNLTHEQKQKYLGLVLPEGYKEWWESLPVLEAPAGAKFDPAFDWRTHVGPYGTTGVTSVKNQDTCGACWAFASVGQLESYVKIFGETELDLSEQQSVSCISGMGCDGGNAEGCYTLFRTFGAVSEECMPYKETDTVTCIQTQCQRWAKISGQTRITNTVASIKQALLTAPVNTGMAVEDTFFSYTDGCYNKDYFGQNHEVLIIGWDDNMCGTGAWLCKNSWGTGWGQQGFFYIKYGICQIGQYAWSINYVFHRPRVRLLSYGVNDQAGGDGDGRAEAGETVRLDFSLKNLWTALGNVSVSVTVDTPAVVITDNQSYLGNMASKDIKNNSSDPMQFQIPADFPDRRLFFTFHVSGDSGGGVIYHADTTVEVFVGHDILLVDDDQGVDSLGTNYEDYYVSTMDSLRSVYDILDKSTKSDLTHLSDYKAVIWFTGNHRDLTFSHADEESLEAYLDGGGRLFITSQDVVEAISGSSDPEDTLFLKHYLHVGYNGSNSRHFIKGYDGDEVGDTLWIYPEITPGANNQTSKDNLVPDSESDTVLLYVKGWSTLTDTVAGSKYGGDYFRVVVFGFGFEAINTASSPFYGHWLSRPLLVMQRVLNWLKAPLPSINLVSPNGGETWFVGDSADILWESISLDHNVKIEYTTDAGSSWITLSGSAANSGVFTLPQVPDTPSNSCKVKISDVDDGSPFDISDNFFAITDFKCGDANGDELIDIGDVIYVINYLFKHGAVPNPKAAGDVNGDCVVDIGDVIYLINYLFKNGLVPSGCCE